MFNIHNWSSLSSSLITRSFCAEAFLKMAIKAACVQPLITEVAGNGTRATQHHRA